MKLLIQLALILPIIGSLSWAADNLPSSDQKARRAEFSTKSRHFDQVEAQLQEEFVGFDTEIRQLMAAVRAITFNPSRSSPTVIPMVSLPGYGKTTLVQRAAQLLGLNNRFRQLDIPQDAVELSSAEVRRLAEPQSPELTNTPAFMLVDEFGHLMPFSKLRKVDVTDGQGSYTIDEPKTRLNSLSWWWQILGNGVAQRALDHNSPSAEALFDNLKSHAMDRKAGGSNGSFGDNNLKQAFQKLASQFPISIYGLNGEIDDLIQQCLANCDDMVQKISENLRKYRANVETYHHLIIFVAGNPQSIIERLFFKFDGQEVTPDQLHAAAASIKNTDLVKWFREIFGSQMPAWESRLRLSQWNFMEPFDNAQWEMAIEKLLKKYEKNFADRMKSLGVSGELKIGQSVNRLFSDKFIDSKNGPRSLYSVGSITLGDLITRSIGGLLQYGEKLLQPVELLVEFDQNNSEFVIETRQDSQKLTEWRFKFDLPSLSNPLENLRSQELVAERRNLMALHQAAYAVAGMIYFGSVPRNLSLNVAPGDEPIHDIWDKPAIADHWHERSHIGMVLAAMSALTAYRSTTFTANIQEKDMDLVRGILQKIINDIEERRKILDFLPKNEKGKLGIEHMIPMSIFNDKVYTALNDGDPSAALAGVYESIQAMLGRNEGLIGAIRQRLLDSPEGTLSGEELKQIVSIHMVSAAQKPIRQRILSSPVGVLNLSPHPLNGFQEKNSLISRFFRFLNNMLGENVELPNKPTPHRPTYYRNCSEALSPRAKTTQRIWLGLFGRKK